MDAKQVREWRSNYEVVNKRTLEEKRQRTPAKRLRILQVFVNGLASLGALRPRADDLEYHLRWQQVREKIQNRNSGGDA